MRFFERGDVPRVKVCGFTDAQNARDVVEAGVDAIGINFWPKSKRFIEPDEAALWLGELAGRVCRIGLFVNATYDEIEAVVDHSVLDAIQLHGDETPEFCADVAAFGLPLIKAIGVRGDAPVADLTEFPTDKILLDAFAPGEFGGTGRSFRWDVAQQQLAANPDVFFILAGGLTPENAAEAIKATGAAAIDLASGVESAPGVKDLAKVRALLSAVR
ncbi:MAG: phosphoribosylanthranilate isomerase [Verrucomicrobiales bacterium]|jgi:phosphoribosylanthranilate isomerase